MLQPLLVLPLRIEFILWTAYLGRRRQLLFTRLVSISGVASRIEGRERWVCEGLDKIPPRTRPPAPVLRAATVQPQNGARHETTVSENSERDIPATCFLLAESIILRELNLNRLTCGHQPDNLSNVIPAKTIRDKI